MKISTYYEILGVEPDATAEQIKQRWRDLAKECHPDRNPEAPDAESRFREVREAFECLSDPQKRAVYDNELRRAARKQSEEVKRRAHTPRPTDIARHVPQQRPRKSNNSLFWLLSGAVATVVGTALLVEHLESQ